MNRQEEIEILVIFREVQATVKELRTLEEDGEEIKVDWFNLYLLPPPMFTRKYFDHWVIKTLTFL